MAELTDAALFVQARMQQEGLTLEYEAGLPLPIWADPGRLRQVFVNVLDNAIKYSPPGGAIFPLTFCRMARTRMFWCGIRAGGISPEDLENVKLKFFKGKGAVRGSGIGLAVVDEIGDRAGRLGGPGQRGWARDHGYPAPAPLPQGIGPAAHRARADSGESEDTAL